MCIPTNVRRAGLQKLEERQREDEVERLVEELRLYLRSDEARFFAYLAARDRGA